MRLTRVRLRSEKGMSLMELLVGMALMSVVMLALLALLDSAISTAPRDEERANSIREGQVGLHVMTRELRQANKVWTPGRTQIYVNIGDDKHVLYDCDAVHPANPDQRQCLRWEAAVGSELPLDQPGQVVVERRVAGDVFTYQPNLINPTFVEVHIEVPQAGDREDGYHANLELNDGFYLRNTDVG
jgi:prepilin-type N-terminal cleavage/methylation domain-containing protein